MKNWFQLARITVMLLPGCFYLAGLAGCESLQDTSFAPLDARLEPIPAGGADYFVVVNTSGQTLHNVRFWVDLWNDYYMTYTGNDPATIPIRRPTLTYQCMGSTSELKPGQVVRFRLYLRVGPEGPVLIPVSRVQIAGSCDEERFREDWQVTRSGQLQPVGAGPRKE
jgi:hypothetical protein